MFQWPSCHYGGKGRGKKGGKGGREEVKQFCAVLFGWRRGEEGKRKKGSPGRSAAFLDGGGKKRGKEREEGESGERIQRDTT